ncbi:neprosin family prolyl endopeptidase [Actinoplanes sp. DH11]|uniref:neprosin family prolyl endopeptidase n=1 Tax=Actinoplanes sp. DH11 TaxID=2857011 RepID=UPI001E5AB492|nr:neprosin family prolyl endopeptidase [Actinoplanes sp. DH11]
MLKSRRGLLAAGLTAAVIGTIGVVSTLNAGAEQIPAAPEPAAAPADPADAASEAPPALRPPASLPWGGRPHSVRTGRDGASSKSLKAAGLTAAAPDEVTEERGEEHAPKGRTSRNTFLKSAKTDVVPPEPPPTGSPGAEVGKPTVNFLYSVGSQAAVSDGAYANLTISKPKLAKTDYHSLAEIAVQSADGAQIVEVGWTVDRTVNGDDDPHLFVYHWVDRKPTCYNTCGFVQYSKNIAPGDVLAQDRAARFGIQFFNGAWWVAFDSEWVGYFPGQIWDDTFTKSGLVQIFGEVAAASPKPCTEMGNGRAAGDGGAARIGSVSYLNGPAIEMNVRATSDVYAVSKMSTRTFRYGGPGAC